MEPQAPAASTGATGADIWWRCPLDVAPAGTQVERALGMIAEGAPLPALCWYWAVEPTLILGVFQPPEVINEAAATARGMPLVRRRSGGTGVLAGPPLLSLDIALPPGHRLALPDVTESYHWLGRAWLTTMEAIGARGARLDIQAESLAKAANNYDIERGNLEGVDIQAAVTDLQKTMLTLQATQASFTKLSQLSLFDYIR
jgi:hypothetical protein